MVHCRSVILGLEPTSESWTSVSPSCFMRLTSQRTPHWHWRITAKYLILWRIKQLTPPVTLVTGCIASLWCLHGSPRTSRSVTERNVASLNITSRNWWHNVVSVYRSIINVWVNLPTWELLVLCSSVRHFHLCCSLTIQQSSPAGNSTIILQSKQSRDSVPNVMEPLWPERVLKFIN